MTIKTTALCAMFTLSVACSVESVPATAPDILADASVVDGSDVDLAQSEPLFKDLYSLEVGVELLFEIVNDSESDSHLLACDPGEGCFMDQCSGNGDCQSGWCVQHLGESLCSQTCQEECPAGWSCKQVAGSNPDVVYICVSDYANLCRPCAANTECTSTGGAEDACLDYGPDGNFCGGPCGADGSCPWGFSCKDVETVEGTPLLQCVTDSGECPCTGSSVALGLTTPCSVTGYDGICEGKRTCTEEGLGSCDAATPAAEICNGIDDDCDGEIDEPDLVEGNYINLCDDGNPCTEDKCMGGEGCVNGIMDSGPCDDGDPCTVADHCVGGACKGETVECDDENPCTDDACKPAGGCLHNANTLPCDDDNPCTVGDHCLESECSGTPVSCECQSTDDCAALEDGDLCNGTLVCNSSALPFVCVVDPETVVVCPQPEEADAFCLAASCAAGTGECSLVPANDGKLCDQTNTCTYGEICLQGTCADGLAVNCNDGNPCTLDTCEPETGCHNGVIEGSCDDGNSCTKDTCDLDLGCLHEALELLCDDGSACTLDDTCVAGVCVGGPAPACDDGNICTSDSCSHLNGCVHSLNVAPCNDGDVCTINDACQLGQCMGTGNLTCDDSNPCTEDLCHSLNGCQFVPNEATCNDGDSCTVGDHCSLGQCQAGSFALCDDENPCTVDSCSPGQGCISSAIEASCDDGDACTLEDWCEEGECQSGEALSCDDDNPCTVDSCDGETGCQFVPAEGNCDDGSVCTQVDTCLAGGCVGSQQLSCSDENPCVDASCDPTIGCVALPNNDLCDDDTCTVADLCADGECSGVTCGKLGQLCGDNGCVDPACHSLSFDGDDYMEVPGHSWKGELSALTIEAWINTKGIGQAGLSRIVNRHLACGAGALGSSFSLHFEGASFLRLWVCSTASPHLVSVGADVGNTLSDNNWHHVAGTWAADGMARVFVDGKKVAEIQSFGGTVGKGSLPLFLAGVPPYAQHYQGHISSVRISPVVRYTEDFEPAELGVDEQVLNFWPLGEGQGIVAHDIGSTAQHGTVVGASWVEAGPWNTCCVPDCEGKPCGEDGCGGSCGECPPPVQIDAIDPTGGFPDENINGTIAGSGFLAGAVVFFDNEQIPVLSVAETAISILIPDGLEPGLYNVKVTNLNGQFDILESGFTVKLDPTSLGFIWMASQQMWYREVNVSWSEWATAYANLDYAKRANSGDISKLAQGGLFQNGEDGWTTTQCVDQDWGTGGRTWIWWQGSILWANNCYPYPGSKQEGHLIWDWIPQ
jgi:hypothetical protein